MNAQAQTLQRLDPHLIYVVDGLTSLAMGIALLFTAAPLTDLAGWAMPASFLWIVGLLLLPWAAYNAWIARTTRPARAVVAANIIGDIAWVVGTATLVAIHASDLTSLGLALLAGQGIAVSGVLLLKLFGRPALVG